MRLIMKLLVVLGILGVTNLTWGNECPFSKESTSTDVFAYLSQHGSLEENVCIDMALRLINDRIPKTELNDDEIQILINFLDHKRRLTDAEKQGFLIHTMTQPDLYPAMEGLFLTGKRSLKFLLPVLSDSISPIIRDNAALTWLFIYRDEPTLGVRALVQASAAAINQQTAKNLSSAAAAVANHCSHDIRAQCVAELPN